MKIPLLIIPFLLAFSYSCKLNSTLAEIQQMADSVAIAEETLRLNNFFEITFNESVNRDPTWQSRLGINKDYDKWTPVSDNWHASELEIIRRNLHTLRDSFNFDLLAPQAKLSYRLWEYNAEQRIAGENFLIYNYPVSQMRGQHTAMPVFLMNVHKIESISDAEAYISRLNGFPEIFSQVIENLQRRSEAGIVAPSFVYPLAIEACQNIIRGQPFDDSNQKSTLLADFTRKLDALDDLDERQKSELINSCRAALIQSVKPAYNELIAYLLAMRVEATPEAGVWKFPEGEAFYNYAIGRMTTTHLSAEEVHEIGLREVSRIHDEIRELMIKVNFRSDDLGDFFEYLRTDEKFYFPQTEEGRQQYLSESRRVIAEMKQRLEELFITLPKASMEVRAVEAFRERSSGKAFYERPAPDGSRPGVYYVNLSDMLAMPTYQLEALAYHEGIPGHHMQIAIAQELDNIPEFRKHSSYTAYIEGWALYAELIPREIGFYKDPFSDIGRLAMELWRACRLVVDSGIHSKGWTREEAIDYLVENTPNPREDSRRAIERYIVMPAQANAYTIGLLKILELREEAKNKLDNQFDIREFHDVLLTNGAVPLDILEILVNEWIASKLN